VPFFLSYLLQLGTLAILVAAAGATLLVALSDAPPTAPAPGRGAAHADRVAWTITLSSSGLPEPMRVPFPPSQDSVEFGAHGYSLGSARLAEVQLVLRHAPEGRLRAETRSAGVRINSREITEDPDPYVVDRDQILFAGDNSVRLYITKAVPS
jgi:hypothetical protein